MVSPRNPRRDKEPRQLNLGPGHSPLSDLSDIHDFKLPEGFNTNAVPRDDASPLTLSERQRDGIAYQNVMRSTLQAGKVLNGALQKLYGLTETEAREVTDMRRKEPDLELRRAIAPLLDSPITNIKDKIAALEKEIEGYESWLQETATHPGLGKILNQKKIADELIEKALFDSGAVVNRLMDEGDQELLKEYESTVASSPQDEFLSVSESDQETEQQDSEQAPAEDLAVSKAGEDPTAEEDRDYFSHEILGYDELQEIAGTLVNTVEAYPDAVLVEHRQFLEQLKSVDKLGAKNLVQVYLDDVWSEAKRQSIFPVVLQKSQYRTARGRAVEFRVNGPLPLLMKKMVERASVYECLADKDAYALFTVFSREKLAEPGLLGADSRFTVEDKVVEGVRVFKANKVGLKDVVSLLRGSSETHRGEVFDCLCEDPKQVLLYKQVKKHGVTPADFEEYLLSHSSVKVGQDRKPFSEVLTSILGNRSQGLAAAFLLKSGPVPPLFGSDVDAVLKIAHNSINADIVLSDYSAACEKEESNRAKLLLRLGGMELSPSELKTIRQQLSATPDSDLDWCSESAASMPDNEVVRRIVRANTAGSGSAPSAKLTTPEKSHWSKVMLHSLKKDGVSDTEVQLVAQVYSVLETLDESLPLRLRSVWRKQPETLLPFCDDAAALLDAHLSPESRSAWVTALKDNGIFEIYTEHLKAKGQGAAHQIEIVIEESVDGNPYGALVRFFHPGESSKHVELEPQDAREMTNVAFPYDRIIIWGGMFSAAAKAKIVESLPEKQVELFDGFTRKSDLARLGPHDMVVWITSSNSHLHYYTIKERCSTKGAGFYHFEQSGMSSVIKLLEGFRRSA